MPGNYSTAFTKTADEPLSLYQTQRSLKYEDIYLKDYASVPELDAGLAAYFRFYNQERLHQSLDYRTPAEIHFG